MYPNELSESPILGDNQGKSSLARPLFIDESGNGISLHTWHDPNKIMTKESAESHEFGIVTIDGPADKFIRDSKIANQAVGNAERNQIIQAF